MIVLSVEEVKFLYSRSCSGDLLNIECIKFTQINPLSGRVLFIFGNMDVCPYISCLF